MLIDSHCHIPHIKYPIKAEQIVKEAYEEGIEKLIVIGTSVSENKKVIKTATDFENVYCNVGIYPHENEEISLEELEKSLVESLGSSDKVVGVGECGIDITNWEGGRPVEQQKSLFEMQIKLAKSHQKPLCIHNRNGDEIVLDLLKKHQGSDLKGVMHCFSSDWNFASQILDLGFYISFAGNSTYSSSKNIHETIEKVPLNRFLVETDSPYLPPQGHRGEVNYPKYVKMVAEKIAQIKQIPFEEVCKTSVENTCNLYNINL